MRRIPLVVRCCDEDEDNLDNEEEGSCKAI